MNSYKKVATVLLWAIISTIVFMLITWGIYWVNANNLVQDRLSELVIMVSEENCLSNDGNLADSPMGMYNNLLKASETDWVKFETNLSSPDISYKVSNMNETQTYYSYITAPQKGAVIKIKLKGYLRLPLIFNPKNTGRNYLIVPIEKTYVTMGMRFYKDK